MIIDCIPLTMRDAIYAELHNWHKSKERSAYLESIGQSETKKAISKETISKIVNIEDVERRELQMKALEASKLARARRIAEERLETTKELEKEKTLRVLMV